ncbi:MAG: hypothetical protein IJV36_04775 [Prevotella sp.]|nr:hypothetical protein [Prevotella sp.]
MEYIAPLILGDLLSLNIMDEDKFNTLDLTPEAYREYKRRHGRHFTKGLCEFAVSLMKREDEQDQPKSIKAMSYREVDRLLNDFGVEVKNAREYDTVFVANMGMADYLADSIPDMEHLARYIKNVIDDPDGYDGIAFNRWFADMCVKRIEVPWEEVM